MQKYHVRFRHVPPDSPNAVFTGSTEVFSKLDATEYDIQVAVANEFEYLNILPEHIRIESFDKIVVDDIGDDEMDYFGFTRGL